jgi:short-subunit dehydrogenase
MENPMKSYKNKWALITGASSGIGKAYAERFAKEGSNLILVARNQLALEALAQELRSLNGVKVIVMAKDLSKLTSPEELFEEVKAAGVHVEILINNAGFAVYGKLHQTDFSRNQEQLMLNIVALSSLTQLFVKPMVENGNSGVIINVASTAGFQPLPYMANYGASKSFVRQFTEALWAEYKADGIKVLAVCPGATETNFFSVVNAKEASVGKRDTPENVVDESLKALACGKIYVIPGPANNFLLSQLGRVVTHKFSAKLTEKVMRPK